MELNLVEGKPPEKEQSNRDLLRFAVIALLVVIPVRVFVAQPFVVSGSSMFPTFANGDYLIINEISYKLGDPQRDDVVIFKYPNDTTKFFIKRVIGLPNETVDIRGNAVTITNGEHKNGMKLDQPFVENDSDNNMHFELKSGQYFVMGDNRNYSSDSRYWGPVARNLMVGKAFLRLLPIKKIGVMPGKYNQAE